MNTVDQPRGMRRPELKFTTTTIEPRKSPRLLGVDSLRASPGEKGQFETI